MINLHKKDRIAFWDITWKQLGIGVACYFVAGLLYWLALWLSSDMTYNSWDQTIINFGLKGLLSLPAYWVVFVLCKQWPLSRQLWLHLLVMPAFIISWFFLFRWVADQFNIGYLEGPGLWWDIYIPMLLYMIQFSTIHAFKYYAKSMRQQVLTSELKATALRSEMSALKAQINPHFLFNTLNSISASLPLAQEKTRELIAHLADTFRYALKASETESVALKDEAEFIIKYLTIEQQRFGNRLQFAVDWPKHLGAVNIPPMLLQPLVENAVLHAVAPSVQPVHIAVTVDEDEDKLHFTIADTGAGWQQASQHNGMGIGLRNTARRLEQQFAEIVQISANHPHGVIIRFSIPVKEKIHA